MRNSVKPYNKSLYPSIETNSNIKYVVNKYNLDQFINKIQEDTFIENIKMLFTNPSEYINNIMAYPLYYVTFGNSKWTSLHKLKIGNVEIDNIDCIRIDGYDKSYLRLAEMYFDRTDANYWTNDYLDYLTKIEMWLPYYGFIDLPSSEVLGKTIYVDYQIDLDTGCASIYISLSPTNQETDSYLYRTYTTNIASIVPVGFTNANDKMKQVVGTGIKLIGGVSNMMSSANNFSYSPHYYKNNKPNAKGEYSKAKTYDKNYQGLPKDLGSQLANGGLDMISAMQNSIQRGELSNVKGFFSLPQQIFFIYTRPNPMNLPDFPHYVGKPCYKTVNLGDLTGFTKVGEVHLQGFGSATARELEMINSALQSGVIL